jgi:hypothetical protein
MNEELVQLPVEEVVELEFAREEQQTEPQELGEEVD